MIKRIGILVVILSIVCHYRITAEPWLEYEPKVVTLVESHFEDSPWSAQLREYQKRRQTRDHLDACFRTPNSCARKILHSRRALPNCEEHSPSAVVGAK